MERLVVLVILIFASFLGAPPSAAAAEIKVCPGCAFKTIGQAIATAKVNDTIFVAPGLYQERDITIDKPLHLIAAPGPERAVIDANGGGSVIRIQADHVEINGFLIKNSGFSYTEEMAGIKISKSANCLIRNNQLENNAFGIYLAESNFCVVSNNQVFGTHKSESLSGNGIHIWKSEGVTIENNELTGNRDGIYFEFVKNSFIRKNKSYANMRYGLHFMYSHYNEYRENLFRDNDCGVAVMYSRGVRMFRNRFEHSHGPSSYGLLLKDINDSTVAGNTFLDNTAGIFIDGTTRTTFEGNLFKNNGWALRVLGDTDSNKFTHNDFLGNTFDVTTNASTSQNEFIGNYWDRYKGLDLDRNGFGDDSFHPVQLSSLLMEHYEISILLIHSVFFSMLDQIENILPALTPETFKDSQPLMKKATGL